MKTSLTIALTAVTLMFGAAVSLMSGDAVAGYDNAYESAGRCGVVPCAYQEQTPTPSSSRTQREAEGHTFARDDLYSGIMSGDGG